MAALLLRVLRDRPVRRLLRLPRLPQRPVRTGAVLAPLRPAAAAGGECDALAAREAEDALRSARPADASLRKLESTESAGYLCMHLTTECARWQNSADPGNVASNKGWSQSRPFTMVTEILRS